MAARVIDNGPRARAIDAPPDWAALWPDDRVNCADCRNRSGAMCVTFRTSHVPLDLVHRCAGFSRRAGR